MSLEYRSVGISLCWNIVRVSLGILDITDITGYHWNITDV